MFFFLNLGVLFDPTLSFTDHIQQISKSSFALLNNFRAIRPYFNQKGFEILINAFISSKLDYCNAIFTGITDSNIHTLQLIQNYAAKLVLNKRKFDHATPLLRELHWLPVKYRIDYKVLLICYKARNSLAPQYISDILVPYTRYRGLRDLAPNSLYVPSTERVSMGDRAFSVCAPKLWNSLDTSIQNSTSLSQYKKALKTSLFRKALN